MTGIVGFGGYVPRLRLQRKAVAAANAWFAPNLLGAAKGERMTVTDIMGRYRAGRLYPDVGNPDGTSALPWYAIR